MTNKRRLVFMALGITTGLILTACAGAVAGQLDSGSGVMAGGSMFQLWQAPAVDSTTADALQVEASYVLGHSMTLSRSAQAVNEMEMVPGHFCMRGDEG
jgi:hypothetical protein